MLTIQFSPLFPWSWIAVLAAIATALLLFGFVRRARGMGWRLLAIAGLVMAIANPVAVEEDREARSDVLAVLVDESASQKIAGREEATERALAHVTAAAGRLSNVELRVIRAGRPDDAAGPVDGTRLFRALGRGIADIPQSRMAGTIVITDGQVHDVPAAGGALPFGGPVHVLLTGKKNEFDRRIVVENAPRYGIVGKEVTVTVRIEDTSGAGGQVNLNLVQDVGTPRKIRIPVGKNHPIKLPLDQAGANILQMEVAALPGELTPVNNRTVISINGVRERLRVLLVSGEPHPGERTWRNLLKADPSVDLVHFTILRPPEKQDMTPVRELSLIAFPIRELFEIKINDFDLIIFDRYRRRGVLPSIYLDNIARYVEGGGAVLEASGPEFSGVDTLFQTPLGRILPGEPTGVVMTGAMRPRLTDKGARHTITADLPGAGLGEELPRWGRWFRQIEVRPRNGLALMSGSGDKPVLMVDRVQKGRVAQLASDHIWLWARGYNGGGPHAELLRRIAHWLMKEPELEENSLTAGMQGSQLAITRRSVEPDTTPVELTLPSGGTQSITLEQGIGGRARALVRVGETGIYRIRDGKHRTLAAVGNINPLEFSDMRTTGSRFAALSQKTGGGIHWLTDSAPELRRVRADRLTAGAGWFGVVDNRNFAIRNVREVPLLPALVVLLLALGTLLLAWRSEGR